VECTFLRDLNGIQHHFNKTLLAEEPLTLSQLLLDFFSFYANFSFDQESVCIISGQPQAKRTRRPGQKNVSYFLDVTNPLEPDLNVAANLQSHAISQFKLKCAHAAATMSACDGEVGLNDIFNGGSGPFKLKIMLNDLGLEEKKLQRQIRHMRGERERVEEGDLSYREERQRREELRKRVPRIRQLFHPPF